MCWLFYCGGVLDFQEWLVVYLGECFLVFVVLGVDLVMIFGVVIFVFDILLEYVFVGLLCGMKIEVVKCFFNDLEVFVSVEIIFEGYIELGEMVLEGLYGDYMGYYNEVDNFLVFIVMYIMQCEDVIYYFIYIGCLFDEFVVLGVVFNEVFVFIL